MRYIPATIAFSTFGLYSAPAVASSQPSACFEKGIDYTGYDILTLSGVESPQLCMESCAQTADCGYWSWASETSSCYLKSPAALLGRTERENIISGPRSCQVEGGCFSDGVDYVGYDINRIEGRNVPSPLACQELCALEPECAFFSYKISTKGCYLKSSAARIGRVSDADVISGPRVCSGDHEDLGNQGNENHGHQGNEGNHGWGEEGSGGHDSPDGEPDIPKESCAEGSVEYRGHDVTVTRNARSAAYCQQLCASNNACFYWTWDKNRNICYQKDEHAAEFRVSGRQTLGKVSGAKDCLPINPGCQSVDSTFLGTVVSQLKHSATFEACQHNCQKEPKCAFWTWDLRTKLCQLREASPYGYVTDSSTVGIVAGPKFCPNDDVCFEQADYVGFDLESIEDGSVTSAIECRTICRHTEGCEFWTWVRSTGSCYLKTEDALMGKTNGLASLGKFSGPRNCFMHYGCMEPNAAYMHSSAAPMKNVGSFKECEQHCQKDGSCGRWTYLPNTRVCILMSPHEAVPKVPLDGALSGSECRTTQNANQNKCLIMGVKYKTTEMSLVSSSKSVNECHFECINTPSCLTFTFDEGVGCYLYDKEATSMTRYPIDFPTAISGTAKCGDDLEGEENTCYENNIIEGSFYAFSASECATRCTEVPSCINWTYNPRKRFESCTFHKAGARKGTCVGARSGSRAAQAATHEFFKYAAPSIIITNVKSAESCRGQCADNGMHYWTYYKEQATCLLHDEGEHNMVADPDAICGTVEDPWA